MIGIKNWIDKLKSSEMVKNVAQISSGTLVGQVLYVALIPIITRIYGATAIGIWAFLNTVILLACSFSDIGLTNALMTEKDEKELRQTYKVASTSTFIVAILVGVVAYVFFGIILPDSLGLLPGLVAIFLCVGIILNQQMQICYTWLNRGGQYKILSKNPIVNAGVFGVLAIVFGLFGMALYGYLLAWVLAQLITLLHMKRFLPGGVISTRLSDFREVCARNRRFVKYQMPANIVLSAKSQLPALLIAPLFGADVLGQYSITMRVIEMPVSLVGTSIGRVFFQKSSELKREGKSIGELNYNLLTNAMKMAFVPVILLSAFGDIAFTWILGAEWQMAGNMVRIFSLYTFFLFLMRSSHGISIVLEKQHYIVISSMVESAFIFVALYFGRHYFDDIYVGIVIISVSFILIQVTFHCLRFRIMGVSIKKFLTRVLLYLLIMIVGYLVLRFPLYYLGIVSIM